MELQGWASFHRKMLKHWVWREKPFTKGQAWVTMVLLANHKPNKVPIKGELVSCDRGQSVRSIEKWSELFGWGRQRTRTFFSHLQKDGMINQEGLHKTTRITICNYDTYQSPEPPDNQQATNRQPTDNQQTTTNNNDNNDNNDKQVPHGEAEQIFEEPTFDEFKEAWNKSGRMKECKQSTFERAQMLEVRCREKLFLANWRKIIKRISQSKYHTGVDGHFKAGVDWLLKDGTNFVKVLEMDEEGYEHKPRGKTYPPGQSPKELARKNLKTIKERRDAKQATRK